MRAVAAILGMIWAAADIVLALFMVLGAFTAKTAQHEGLLAQASLLLGGVLIGAFSVALGWVCLRMLVPSGRERTA